MPLLVLRHEGQGVSQVGEGGITKLHLETMIAVRSGVECARRAHACVVSVVRG